MNQKVAHYPMIVIALGAIYHAIAAYILYSVLDWGFYGICWATGSMFFLRGVIALILIMNSSRFKKFDDVHLFSKETFTNIGPLLTMGLKSLAMGVWGWWAFDFFTLMSSYLGPNEVATQTIMRSIGLLTFMIPVGFSFAVKVFTGNNLGEGKPLVAKMYYKVNLTCAICVTLITMTLLYFGKEKVIGAYTE